MRHRLKIAGILSLAVNVVAGMAHAQNKNPWAFYQRDNQFQDERALVLPRSPAPSAELQLQKSVKPQFFGNEYVPLEPDRKQQVWPGMVPGQQQPGVYGQYRYQPYAMAPGYGYQLPFSGNYGGQFGFGMNFNPGFGGSGMPFGFGYPSLPFFGGGNPYGNPYRGYSPWGMGFPMF